MDEIFEQSDGSIKIEALDVTMCHREVKTKASVPSHRTKTTVVYLHDHSGMVVDDEMENSFYPQEDYEPNQKNLD